MDLADRANHKVGQLSGGEQQRAAIAVALSNTPMLLLADEPTAELDSVSADRVLESFRAVNREFGVTIVMVTHDLTAARRADRRIRVRDGRILHEGLAVEPVGSDGRVRLPDEAVAALGDAELEAEVSRTRSACGGGARPAMPEPILEAQAIVRTYAGANGVLAVRGASLALTPKDFVALMGPSGSGKTTFIGVLSGLDRPDEGEVRWKGTPMGSLSSNQRRTLRRTEMGVVFQSFGLLPTLSAVENVELPLRFSGATLDEARERATAWLTRLGLGDRLDNRTFELSAGQQQRVAVARALIAEPEVVLADEPIAEVDTENADLILEALWDVIRRGGAVLAATHNPEALRYANRVVLFRDGQIDAEGTPDELASRITTD